MKTINTMKARILASIIGTAMGTTGCGHVGTTTRTQHQVIAIQDLPTTETRLDTAPSDDADRRLTRVTLHDGRSFALGGDVRMYRGEDHLILQPDPQTLMLREIPLRDVARAERIETWNEVETGGRGPSSGETAGIVFGVVGALVLGALVAHAATDSMRGTAQGIGRLGGATGSLIGSFGGL